MSEILDYKVDIYVGKGVGRQKKEPRKATDMSHLTLSCNQFELGGYMKIILCQLHQISEKHISVRLMNIFRSLKYLPITALEQGLSMS